LETESHEITVTLAEHPESNGKPYLGVTFVPMAGDEFGPGEGSFWFHRYGDHDGCDEHDENCDEHFEGRLDRFEFRWPRR
jgi:hypothetical protein